jgi:hypothetical protein
MNESEQPDQEKFWTRKTLLQIIFLVIASGAFLVGLVAIVSTKLVH